MNNEPRDGWSTLFRLARFLFWYGTAVTALVYLLPLAGAQAELHYDALDSTTKILVLGGFFAAIGAWQFRRLASVFSRAAAIWLQPRRR